MEIVFGITHYNRFELLNLCLDFFENLDFQKVGITVKINLYDDVSNKLEYDDFIRTNRHKFHRVIRNEQNRGSTGNIYNMYIDFLENETARFFFNFDSDLVVSESFPRVLINFLESEIGHISFYNSSSHGRKTIGILYNEPVVSKEHLGSAGTLFSRECLADIIANVPCREIAFDWDWSKYLIQNGKIIYCTYRSYFLHIGFNGDNNSLSNINYGFDRALNFYFNRKEKLKPTYKELKSYLTKHNVSEKNLVLNSLRFYLKKYVLWIKV